MILLRKHQLGKLPPTIAPPTAHDLLCNIVWLQGNKKQIEYIQVMMLWMLHRGNIWFNAYQWSHIRSSLHLQAVEDAKMEEMTICIVRFSLVHLKFVC